MSRSAGGPKTGGRKKGTPNKRTLDLQVAIQVAGIDVVGELAKHFLSLQQRRVREL